MNHKLLKKLFQIILFFFFLFEGVCFSETVKLDGNIKKRIREGRLPDFCIATQGWKETNPTLYKKYLNKYGQAWSHMHHCCIGIEDMNLGKEATSNKNFYFQSAISEFDYVLKRSNSKFKFKPFVYKQKGDAFFLLGNYIEASGQYLLAVKLKKNYVDAYIGLYNVSMSHGDRTMAKKYLLIGLEHSANSKILKKYLIQLDGNNSK